MARSVKLNWPLDTEMFRVPESIASGWPVPGRMLALSCHGDSAVPRSSIATSYQDRWLLFIYI
ncbi:hypothetical protein DPMN_079567 [Dreissena polymorpha]|uniref:Uncharacterized protein n=1 Tax=Dreissena polymorpha TaxID=45954 RepID=A0A9D3YQZ6_DREPO|nr:hypothetical protein DPMN_079567 [Dreissena polymorpha]